MRSISAFLCLLFVVEFVDGFFDDVLTEVPDQCFAQQQELSMCNQFYASPQPRVMPVAEALDKLPSGRDWFHLKVTEHPFNQACVFKNAVRLSTDKPQTIYYKHFKNSEKYTKVFAKQWNPSSEIRSIYGVLIDTYEIFIPYSPEFSSLQGQTNPGVQTNKLLVFDGFKDIEILRWPTLKMGATVFSGSIPCGTSSSDDFDWISGKLNSVITHVRVSANVTPPNLPTFWPFEFTRTNASEFNVTNWNVSNVTSIHPFSSSSSLVFLRSTFPRGLFTLRWNTLEVLHFAVTILMTKQDLADIMHSRFPNTQLAFRIFHYVYLDTTNETDFQLLTFPEAKRIVMEPLGNVWYVQSITDGVRKFKESQLQSCVYQEYKTRVPAVERLKPVDDRDICASIIRPSPPPPLPPTPSPPPPEDTHRGGLVHKSWRQATIGCIVGGGISLMLAIGFAIAWRVEARRHSKDDRDAARYSRLGDGRFVNSKNTLRRMRT